MVTPFQDPVSPPQDQEETKPGTEPKLPTPLPPDPVPWGQLPPSKTYSELKLRGLKKAVYNLLADTQWEADDAEFGLRGVKDHISKKQAEGLPIGDTDVKFIQELQNKKNVAISKVGQLKTLLGNLEKAKEFKDLDEKTIESLGRLMPHIAEELMADVAMEGNIETISARSREYFGLVADVFGSDPHNPAFGSLRDETTLRDTVKAAILQMSSASGTLLPDDAVEIMSRNITSEVIGKMEQAIQREEVPRVLQSQEDIESFFRKFHEFSLGLDAKQLQAAEEEVAQWGRDLARRRPEVATPWAFLALFFGALTGTIDKVFKLILSPVEEYELERREYLQARRQLAVEKARAISQRGEQVMSAMLQFELAKRKADLEMAQVNRARSSKEMKDLFESFQRNMQSIAKASQKLSPEERRKNISEFIEKANKAISTVSILGEGGLNRSQKTHFGMALIQANLALGEARAIKDVELERTALGLVARLKEILGQPLTEEEKKALAGF